MLIGHLVILIPYIKMVFWLLNIGINQEKNMLKFISHKSYTKLTLKHYK